MSNVALGLLLLWYDVTSVVAFLDLLVCYHVTSGVAIVDCFVSGAAFIDLLLW